MPRSRKPAAPTLDELIQRGAKTVSQGGQHHILCDGSGKHWIADHRYSLSDKRYIAAHGPCWCKKMEGTGTDNRT